MVWRRPEELRAYCLLADSVSFHLDLLENAHTFLQAWLTAQRMNHTQTPTSLGAGSTTQNLREPENTLSGEPRISTFARGGIVFPNPVKLGFEVRASVATLGSIWALVFPLGVRCVHSFHVPFELGFVRGGPLWTVSSLSIVDH